MAMEEKKKRSAKLTAFYIVFVFAIIVTVFACEFYNFYGSALFASDSAKQSKANSYALENLKLEKGGIVFFGDSITEMCDLDYYYPEYNALNRGISGDTTEGMLERLESNLLVLEPDVVFFLGGANDLGRASSPSDVNSNIKNIISRIKTALPNTVIYVQSVYPVNPNVTSLAGNHVGIRDNEDILLVNSLLRNTCLDLDVTFLDTFALLVDLEGRLNEQYTFDGLHINAKAYEVVSSFIKQNVNFN